MRKNVLLVYLTISLMMVIGMRPSIGFGQLNLPLKRELDSMLVLDQCYRGYLSKIANNQDLSDSLMKALNINDNLTGVLWTYQNRIDSLNLIRVEQIIQQYGYPGRSVVGQPTNEAVFYIVQHSPKIKTYFPLVKQAAQASQLPFHLSAMMEDRLLTEQLKPQIYGTQVASYPLRSNSSKQEWFVWPISDPLRVNQRRSKAGFTQSVEDNAKRLGVKYAPLTMEEAKRRYALTNQ